MDPDQVCPESLDPDPDLVCPERLDLDPDRSTSDRIRNPATLAWAIDPLELWGQVSLIECCSRVNGGASLAGWPMGKA